MTDARRVQHTRLQQCTKQTRCTPVTGWLLDWPMMLDAADRTAAARAAVVAWKDAAAEQRDACSQRRKSRQEHVISHQQCCTAQAASPQEPHAHGAMQSL